MSTKQETLAALTLAVMGALDARQSQNHLKHDIEKFYGEKPDVEGEMPPAKLAAALAVEGGISLRDLLDTLSDVWEETVKVRVEVRETSPEEGEDGEESGG